ncbi:MAG: hypothetical protein WCV59_02570 [Parcubacteria group bacterium]|jgi:hypothetical protein
MITDPTQMSDEDKKRKKHSIEMEMVILESDQKKMISQKTALEAEIRKLKYDEERIRVTLDEKKEELEKATYILTQNEEEVKRLKKQLNLVI